MLLRDKIAKPRPALTFGEIEALPQVLKDVRDALLIVKTDQGNLARVLVSPGFRKRPGDQGPMVPLLLLERFDVFDSGNPAAQLAQGRNLALFPGFQLDLDTGQVVPEGLGGDLLFSAQGQGAGIVKGVGSAVIATLEGPPALPPPTARPGVPSEGRIVRPGDFSGRFRLAANGQWSGLLELKVDPAGAISGSFQSDVSKSPFPVSGNVDPHLPQKAQFAIQFPRARQDYQGVIWTEGKNVMAGTLAMLGQEFSFVAVREGAKSVP
jgi:hypothetical protein